MFGVQSSARRTGFAATGEDDRPGLVADADAAGDDAGGEAGGVDRPGEVVPAPPHAATTTSTTATHAATARDRDRDRDR